MDYGFIVQELPLHNTGKHYKGTGGKAGREPGHGRWKRTEMEVPGLGLMLVPYANTGICPYGQISCFTCGIDPRLCKGGE